MIGTQIAAAILECDDSYIRQLIGAGRLPAIKIGRSWVLEEGDVERFKRQRDHNRARHAGVPITE